VAVHGAEYRLTLLLIRAVDSRLFHVLGQELWVKAMNWDQLSTFTNMDWTPEYAYKGVTSDGVCFSVSDRCVPFLKCRWSSSENFRLTEENFLIKKFPSKFTLASRVAESEVNYPAPTFPKLPTPDSGLSKISDSHSLTQME